MSRGLRITLTMQKSLLEAPECAAFLNAASRYCDWIEITGGKSGRAALLELLDMLVMLYHCALTLPVVDPGESAGGRLITHEEWVVLYERLSEELGAAAATVYWFVFEPFSLKEESVVCNTLTDDCADIYRDLKNGFLSLSANEEAAAVVWDWRFSFQTHWGQHAVNAISALHSGLHGGNSIWLE